MCSHNKPKHWLIRVQNSENFRNCKYPFFGVKRGRGVLLKHLLIKLEKEIYFGL